ncbi:MAG TPA: type II secretion system protein GspD [Comamonadaceae bacterium]|nr:type II secretion system protein GspD [Comamonadaceae bacterium]
MTSLTKHRLHFAITTIAASALLASASGIIHAQTAIDTGTASVRPGEPVTLNFANAEIEAVARTMATITGRNVVVDPRVKGQLNLVTERAVTPAAAFQQFLAALRLQGFTVVESAGLYKVVPEADAKLQGGSVSVAQPGSAGPAGGQIVTQIYKLNYESASNLVPVLRPLISPNNTINVNPGTNALVITDYADNLQRLGKIIAAMDVSNASDVEIIPLQHAIATDLAPLVARLIDSGSSGLAGAAGGAAAGQTDTSFKTTLLAEPRSNALILRAANPARLAQVRSLVAKLDQPAAAGSSAASGNIHVVYLKNADATKLAATLRAAMAAGTGQGAGGGTSAPAATSTSTAPAPASSGLSGGSATGMGSSSASSSQPSTGGQIQADPTTNSLIITAPEPQYRQLRAVIDKLDGRRAQVLVESLIVEVNADKVAEFGIQWQTALGAKGDSNIGLIGTNYSAASGAGANIINLATATPGTVRPGGGLNFGLGHNFGGKYGLSVLARFLETNGDGNVLSTPNLLTLDNEEAKIIIGQNVPFITGQYTNNNSNNGSVNPFQTIERKDVGLSLRVRPQISENGTVKLAIFQEVSDVVASTINNLNGPTTSKRSIESNVLVEDGSIVVLGGLLQDKYSGGQEKVPGLGDIPLFGNLFKSESRSRNKTNLMVFLRPIVIRDAASSEALALDRYDMIRATQEGNQPDANIMLRAVPQSPVVPALTRAVGTSVPAGGKP